MTENRIFPMASGGGYGAVIHGNFVEVRIDYRGFSAMVAAFQTDGNVQYQPFDNLADAVAWAVATAATHQGRPHPRSKIEYWEIRNGYSITVEPADSGGYEAETFPMWIDAGPEPIRDSKTFPTRDEAVEWARQSADEQSQRDADYQQQLRQIRDTLEAHSGEAHSG